VDAEASPHFSSALPELGAFHSCAILTDGTAKCWGYNLYGGLGNGTTMSASFPGAVANFVGGRMIGGGRFHTCAAWQGGVQCWGDNWDGQLGNNSTKNSYVPVDVIGL
jgi:alpha-tubulin suppressor-like RCC1 family protein